MLFILLVISVCFSKEILSMTEENIKEVIDGAHYVFVKYYAPWCDHCTRFAPMFQQIADSYEKFDSIRFAAIDCSMYKDKCVSFLVTGYPTVHLFTPERELKPLPYMGKRTVVDIVNFINYNANLQASVAPARTIKAVPFREFQEIMKKGNDFSIVMMWRKRDDNNDAIQIMEKLSYLFSGNATIHFYWLQVDDLVAPHLKNMYSIEQYPSFIIKNDEYIEFYLGKLQDNKVVIDESRLLDVINVMMNRFINIHGKERECMGCLPEIDAYLSSISSYTEANLKQLEKVIEKTEEELEISKEIYRRCVAEIREEGMEIIWKQLHDLNKELSEMQTDDSDYSDMIAERNIVRQFLKSWIIEKEIIHENDEL